MLFLANENIPLKSILLLRKSGYAVAAIMEDSPGIKDEQVLSRAADENRIILTFDRDYGELVYKKKLPTPSGIIYFRFTPATPEETAEIFFQLMGIVGITLENRFTIVERTKIRQRKLF